MHHHWLWENKVFACTSLVLALVVLASLVRGHAPRAAVQEFFSERRAKVAVSVAIAASFALISRMLCLLWAVFVYVDMRYEWRNFMVAWRTRVVEPDAAAPVDLNALAAANVGVLRRRANVTK